MKTLANRMQGVMRAVLAVGLIALGACGDDDDAASPDTGTIKIVVEDWEGVEGYRLLAGFNGGGAFWTIIDSDPWSGEDVVHPPYWGEGEYDGGRDDGWGAGDYMWDQTAQLEPGSYSIQFWANPGELAPYGSHIPAEPIERGCSVEVEVAAGETATVVISDIPPSGGDTCPDASWSSD
jgi:hypothetical protein